MAGSILAMRGEEDVTISNGKGLIRSQIRKGVRTGKLQPEERRTGRSREPLACKRCGGIFRKRVWRPGTMTRSLRAQVTWVVCPACAQQAQQLYQGRIVIDLARSGIDPAEIRRRILNVAARAGHTQPQRRVVSVEQRGSTLEVLSTSEKLAHRITGELAKVWRGRASYEWSDDGSLFARWRPGRSKE